MSAPTMGDVKRLSSLHTRSVISHLFLKEFGTLRRDLEHHVAIRDGNLSVAAEVPVEERVTAIAQSFFRTIIRARHKTVQRHRHVENNVSHQFLLSRAWLRGLHAEPE